jgi:hypothetical protein
MFPSEEREVFPTEDEMLNYTTTTGAERVWAAVVFHELTQV